jgi:hypothetical protein
MWKRDELISRALAVLVGAALFLFQATVPSQLLGDNSPLLMPLDVAVYGITGLVFGFIWPDGGWRLGLYLFAIWLPMLLFGAFLAGEVPWDQRATLNLLGYVMILVAACLGAGLGTLIRRARSQVPNSKPRRL